MKNIKDITISIFAIIGFVFILSSFNNEKPIENGDWVVTNAGLAAGYLYNSKTGEAIYMQKDKGEKVIIKK
ncbi:hypothetical protein N9600_00060 [Flavobacteriaceae bacterium]|jgi:hypothetical protein|nr:hypothetical protein [Flavobacteriaceae bacterium]MDB4005933.1 hypothetical protein [Flavobacteriaceae bacterium]MDB4130530.1 hypothetical protein [Flavobacteriaceae bacterium]